MALLIDCGWLFSVPIRFILFSATCQADSGSLTPAVLNLFA